MKEKLEVHVGGALEDTGRRFIDAWHRLENGKRVRERHLSFESLEALLSLLTPKRWELLNTFTVIRSGAFEPFPNNSSATTAGSTTMSMLWRRRACWNGMAESCEQIMMGSIPHSGLTTRNSDQGNRSHERDLKPKSSRLHIAPERLCQLSLAALSPNRSTQL